MGFVDCFQILAIMYKACYEYFYTHFVDVFFFISLGLIPRNGISVSQFISFPTQIELVFRYYKTHLVNNMWMDLAFYPVL